MRRGWTLTLLPPHSLTSTRRQIEATIAEWLSEKFPLYGYPAAPVCPAAQKTRSRTADVLTTAAVIAALAIVLALLYVCYVRTARAKLLARHDDARLDDPLLAE